MSERENEQTSIIDDYYGDFTHISQSMLKVLDESPLLFYHRFVKCDIEDKDSDDKRLGRCLHALLLERDRFHELCPRMPMFENDEANVTKNGKRSHSKSTTYYQAKKDEFQIANAGRDVIDDDEYTRLTAMEAAIWKHEDAKRILTAPGSNEVTVRWEDRIPRKARMDCPRPQVGVVADIKGISGRPTPRNFSTACAKFRWYLQPPMYLDAMCQEYGPAEYRFLYIVVGKAQPHEVGIYELDNEVRGRDERTDAEWAEHRLEDLVTELIERRESGNWSAGWQRGVTTSPMPAWVRSSYYDLED